MHAKKWRESKVEIKVKKMKLNFYENQKGDINWKGDGMLWINDENIE